MPLITKLGKVVAYLEVLLPKRSHGSWVRWSCELKKPYISTTTVPLAPNVAGSWLTSRRSYLKSQPCIKFRSLSQLSCSKYPFKSEWVFWNTKVRRCKLRGVWGKLEMKLSFLRQSWTKYYSQIYKIKSNRFFCRIFYDWFSAVF